MSKEEAWGSLKALNSLMDPKAVKQTAASLRPGAEELALCEELLKLHAKGLRNVVDGVVGITAKERKVYVQPWVDLGKTVVKEFKPNSRGYVGPLRGRLRVIAKNYSVFLGWLKNRHKYKEGELLPPASSAELQVLQETLRKKMDDTSALIPSALCDCWSICGGMAPNVRTNPMGGLTIFRLDEVPAAYDDMVKRFDYSDHMTPLSEDGAGNLYAVSSGNDVFTFNHEDGDMSRTISLPKLIAKAHKVTR